MSLDPALAQLKKLGEGREAEVFAWAEGRALRLFRAGFARTVEHERLAIAAARAGRIPAPQLDELVSVAGREGVVLDRVDGETQLELVGRKPWILPREARRTGRLHARLHTIAAPAGLRSLQGWVRSGSSARTLPNDWRRPPSVQWRICPRRVSSATVTITPVTSSSKPAAGTS